MISSWSHSKLEDFSKCKFLCYLKHVAKIPEPERPLPPGKTEHANDRGTRLHQNAEDFVSGKTDFLLSEIDKSFGCEVGLLRELYVDGKVSLEGEWAMDDDWTPMPWSGEWRKALPDEVAAEPKKVTKLPERAREFEAVYCKGQLYVWMPAWFRCKLDAIVHWSPTEATVIDYKSGRKFGNEIKHGEQMQLYQLSTFLRFPKLETVHTQLWYLDQNDTARQTFSRTQGLRFKNVWDRKGHALTSCDKWPANPNIFSCQYCQYGPWNGGQCTVGVKKGWNGA